MAEDGIIPIEAIDHIPQTSTVFHLFVKKLYDTRKGWYQNNGKQAQTDNITIKTPTLKGTIPSYRLSC